MSIITLASTKGGAGKTTLARLLLGRLAPTGLRLAAIDADFNRSLFDWVTHIAKVPVDVHHELDESEILPLTRRLAADHDVVIIDTAGSAEQSTLFAIGVSDLVLIPVQPSAADIVEAKKTWKHVKNIEAMVAHPPITRVVMMAVQPLTNIVQHVESKITTAGLPLLDTRLSRLVAYQEMTFNGVVPTTGPAGQQATALIDEITALGVLPAAKPQQLATA